MIPDRKTGGRRTSEGCRKDGRDRREVWRIHRKPSIKEWKQAWNTGPGVPERPERKGKSEDGKITWKKTRREEFCNDSKKYREPKGAGMKSPGPGCTGTKAGAIVTRVYGKESDDPLGQNWREREKGWTAPQARRCRRN
ncbi:hypothetical protein B0H11DRAFT_1900585 [Mycena galericulata]|nr:hypothetical protein B0H11DRAFT_1900581 [Mycena galericulata]KAJ7510232.1 hypothetical protein B0H11DRAFT_1900585 [Mycena galericulata]